MEASDDVQYMSQVKAEELLAKHMERWATLLARLK